MLLEGYGLSWLSALQTLWVFRKEMTEPEKKERKNRNSIEDGDGGGGQMLQKSRLQKSNPYFNEQQKSTLIFLHFEVRFNYSRFN